MKKQVVVIHGGMVFDSNEDFIESLSSYEAPRSHFFKKVNWTDRLQENLLDYEVFTPEMPNKQNAKYNEWKLWFDKLVSYLETDVVLIGRSLGGIFLTKYLNENKLPFKVKSLHLVATPFDAEGTDQSIGDFILSNELTRLKEQVEDVYLYYSKDDPVTPLHNLQKYIDLMPDAKAVIFEDRQHFGQNEFPELIENIVK